MLSYIDSIPITLDSHVVVLQLHIVVPHQDPGREIVWVQSQRSLQILDFYKPDNKIGVFTI